MVICMLSGNVRETERHHNNPINRSDLILEWWIQRWIWGTTETVMMVKTTSQRLCASTRSWSVTDTVDAVCTEMRTFVWETDARGQDAETADTERVKRFQHIIHGFGLVITNSDRKRGKYQHVTRHLYPHSQHLNVKTQCESLKKKN